MSPTKVDPANRTANTLIVVLSESSYPGMQSNTLHTQINIPQHRSELASDHIHSTTVVYSTIDCQSRPPLYYRSS